MTGTCTALKIWRIPMSWTQLYNRRQFVHMAERRIHEWPTPASSCLLMLDVDYFKKINDAGGYDSGDRVRR